MNKLLIKAFESHTGFHEIHVFTDKNDFLAFANLREVEGYLEVDGPLARKGFGRYLYDFLAMYAHENEKNISNGR